MSTKADTPISVLPLSLALSAFLSVSLSPSNHQLHSLRVVTTLLTLHWGMEASEFNTHTQARTYTQRRPRPYNPEETNSQFVDELDWSIFSLLSHV